VIDPSELLPAGTVNPFPPGALALAYADGACRGNPGPAAYGVVYALEDGTPLAREAAAIGEATNNVAEYRGLLAALERLAAWGLPRVLLRLDSELVVRQMQGRYKVKNEGLRPLHERGRQLSRLFVLAQFEHVPREQNKLADKLANLALDAASQSERP
jgi:probable phosphoglycerate mutase